MEERPDWARPHDAIAVLEIGETQFKVPPSVSPTAPRPQELKLDNYLEGEENPTEAHSEEDAGLRLLLRKAQSEAGPAVPAEAE